MRGLEKAGILHLERDEDEGYKRIIYFVDYAQGA